MAGLDSWPSLKPDQVVRALKRCGFIELRQKGSHLVLYNQRTKNCVTKPMHKGKDVKKPLLRKIIELEAGLTINMFKKALKLLHEIQDWRFWIECRLYDDCYA